MQCKHEHHLPPNRREKDMLPPKIEESSRHRYGVPQGFRRTKGIISWVGL